MLSATMRRCPPGVLKASSWPSATMRLAVGIETPKSLAASLTEQDLSGWIFADFFMVLFGDFSWFLRVWGPSVGPFSFRFFTIFSAFCCGLSFCTRLPAPVTEFLRSPVRTVPSSPAPDFLSKLRALGFGRLVDDLSAGVVLASAVLKGGLNVLSQVLCAGIAGIVLAGSPSLARAGRRDSKSRVTPLAEPAEIFRRVVPLVAVAVVYHQEAGRAANLASSRAGRDTLLSAVSVRPVRYLFLGLAPALATFRRRCYSSPDSSSSSSSSPMMSLISSSWPCNSSFSCSNSSIRSSSSRRV